MLGTYFYHEILRKTVIGFGTLFNNINIRHTDASGTNVSTMKVPLAYGPMQKFLHWPISQWNFHGADIRSTRIGVSYINIIKESTETDNCLS